MELMYVLGGLMLMATSLALQHSSYRRSVVTEQVTGRKR